MRCQRLLAGWTSLAVALLTLLLVNPGTLNAAAHPEDSSTETKAKIANSGKSDIHTLTQYFTGESEDTSPWMFVPRGNIRSVSTSEHPGHLTIWHADTGEGIKGRLKEPIKISDYPTPCEFHLGLAQYRSGELPERSNYAIRLNIAVTFSDPSMLHFSDGGGMDIERLKAELSDYGFVVLNGLISRWFLRKYV
jgi:hypothetical protein